MDDLWRTKRGGGEEEEEEEEEVERTRRAIRARTKCSDGYFASLCLCRLCALRCVALRSSASPFGPSLAKHGK